MNYYARLKPHSPRQGNVLNRYHYLGNLFVGGERPNWYRVDADYAVRLRQDKQETGTDSFDVVTPEEKIAIDKREEELKMVAMGLMASTLQAPKANVPHELTMPKSARDAAIPEASSGDLTTKDLSSPIK